MREFRLHTRERSTMRSRRRIVVDVAGQTVRAIRRMSPREPDPARRFGRVDDDATVRRGVELRDSRELSHGLPRSSVVTSHGPHASCAVVVPLNLKSLPHLCLVRWDGMDAGARSGAQRGVLIIVYGTCATNAYRAYRAY